jgi:hypothetical protein
MSFPQRRSPGRTGTTPGFLSAHKFFLFLILFLILAAPGVIATTTSLHIEKIGVDGKTIIAEKTVDYRWMEQNLPVEGDGTVHYYHQGPVFADDSDPAAEELLRWNQPEDQNVREKDMGAVKGTKLADLTDLVGGMNAGDTVRVKADDGFSRTFAYENVYTPPPRQGPMVITWFRADDGYVPNYTTGMRLVFFADNYTNPWGIHAFGNWDWHESAAPESWYFYIQGNERYPTTTGLSVQSVSEITVYEGNNSAGSGTSATSGPFPGLEALLIICALGLAGLVFIRSR